MNNLIFIGGAKGIGKTTLTTLVAKQLDHSSINTGDLVTAALNNHSNPEAMIVHKLIDYCGIVDTHYAGCSKMEFVRGLSTINLSQIARGRAIELVLLDLDVETLLKRRMFKNQETFPERYHDPEFIQQELDANRQYFREYCKELSINGVIIINYALNDAINKLMRWLK